MSKDGNFIYAPSHIHESTCHGLCCASRRALAGVRNSLTGPPWGIDPMTNSLAYSGIGWWCVRLLLIILFDGLNFDFVPLPLPLWIICNFANQLSDSYHTKCDSHFTLSSSASQLLSTGIAWPGTCAHPFHHTRVFSSNVWKRLDLT